MVYTIIIVSLLAVYGILKFISWRFDKKLDHDIKEFAESQKYGYFRIDSEKEIRMAKDAIDTLDKYKNGEMKGIANQHIDEIKRVIEKYIDIMED